MSEEEPRERQPSERIREMARSLHEPKVGLLQRLADKIGMEKMEEFYQRTLELEAAGGMPTANGKRRRTAGGVFFQLTREILTPRERRKIFREKKPKPATPAQSAERKRAPQPPSSPALQPPTTEQVAAALKAAASIPADKKGQAIM